MRYISKSKQLNLKSFKRKLEKKKETSCQRTGSVWASTSLFAREILLVGTS